MVVKITLTVKGVTNGNFFHVYYDSINEANRLTEAETPISYETIKYPAYVLYTVPEEATTIIIVDAGFGSGIPAVCDTNIEGQGKITIDIDKSLCV